MNVTECIQSAYHATWRPDAHWAWLDELRKLVELDQITFQFKCSETRRVRFIDHANLDQAHSIYVKKYYQIDPMQPKVQSISRLKLEKLDEVWSEIDKDSKYYKEHFSKLGFQHGIATTLDLAGLRTQLSLLRKKAKPFSHNELRAISEVLPHIESAARLYARNRRNILILDALKQAPFSISIVDNKGDVIFENKLARNASLDASAGNFGGDVWEDRREGLLPGFDTKDVSELPLALPAWSQSRKSQSNVLVGYLKSNAETPASAFRELWGLTERETYVCTELLTGKPTKEIAASLGIQTASVRAHIKSALSKTGTHSQVELLHKLRTKSWHRSAT